ncbi:MAG: hypothetical protein JWO13_2119 [Acidobacteriales bacterium]|nr:hypothetical protein [Terriglobales bacterium]
MAIDEQDVREFFEQWSTTVFTYCRLYMGEEEPAETAAHQAFVRYLSEEPDLSQDKKIPLRLLRHAYLTCRNLGPNAMSRFPDTEEMEEMVKLLPAEERGVFILKSVLDLDFNEIAAVTGMTVEQVHRLWSESLLHVRDLWLKKAS